MFTAPDEHMPYIIQLHIMSIQPAERDRERERWGGGGGSRQERGVAAPPIKLNRTWMRGSITLRPKTTVATKTDSSRHCTQLATQSLTDPTPPRSATVPALTGHQSRKGEKKKKKKRRKKGGEKGKKSYPQKSQPRHCNILSFVNIKG